MGREALEWTWGEGARRACRAACVPTFGDRPARSAAAALVAGVIALACSGSSGESRVAPASNLPPHSAADGATGHPTTAYYGDLHVHTALSADAYILGTRASIDDAFRFAKGEPIDHVSGRPIQAKRALDFLAVTDHAEYLGQRERLLDPASLAGTRIGAAVTGISKAFAVLSATISRARPHPAWQDDAIAASTWRETIEAANRHHASGRFTTLLGFEWSATPEGRNLHRNVILHPDGPLPERPISVFDAPEPEGLWGWMDDERARGVRLLAIPHNSNLSDGSMFVLTDSAGRPLDAEAAATRVRNEPLVEITQIKGTSETHPSLSPDDPFAGFEIWSSRVAVDGEDPNVALAGSYVRDALRRGVSMQSNRGFDPFRLGFIGSSDSHSASSPVEEDNYSGKGVQDTTAEMRILDGPLPDSVQAWGASGLAAVWATENTRDEIYAALARRETFATTGPRIRLRFFAGWDFEPDLTEATGWVARAYAEGTPMGGTLRGRPGAATAPRFVVSVLRDPQGARLERVQIVKGWAEAGATRERVFDVAVAGSGGAASLEGVWRDPAFDPERPAFYYARAIEVPTPRWSTLDARRLGVDPPANRPTLIQERAFGSPVWYVP